MKKLTTAAILASLLFSILFLCGCGASMNDILNGSGDATIIIGGYTVNAPQGISKYITCDVASGGDITSYSPANLTVPDAGAKVFQTMTRRMRANEYYYSTNTNNQGGMDDPFYESTQRQLYASVDKSEPLNGTYEVTLGSVSKEIPIEETYYMPVINTTDVSTTGGPGYINVTNGETITVYNQSNSNYRYLCRIYDTQSGESAVQRLWTSSNIRTLYWTDTEGTYNFFAYNTTAPANGMVRFTLPAGVLKTGTQNLTMVISAYDTSLMKVNTDGDLESLTWAVSEAYLNFSGR